MFKSVIKEVFIILLLIIVILLALCIVFYDYNPTSKKEPSKVEAYVLPEDVEQELAETLDAVESQNIVKTYRVDSDDLQRDVKSGDYVKGKPNPFSKIPVSTEGQTSGGTGSSSGTGTNGGNSSNNSHFIKEVK